MPPIRALTLCLATVPALPAPAMSDSPYDGTYRPDAPWAADWDCQRIGRQGGAIAVRDGTFYGAGSVCELRNPVDVRDMQATLFDAICVSGGARFDHRLMLMRLPQGIAAIQDGLVTALRRCD